MKSIKLALAIGALAIGSGVVSGTLTTDNLVVNTSVSFPNQSITRAMLADGGTGSITGDAGVTATCVLPGDCIISPIYGTTAMTIAQGNDSRITGAVQNTRQIICGPGLVGCGPLSSDLTLATSANGDGVRLATNAALAANTFTSVTCATTTIMINAMGILTVDGVATALNDIILVKDEGTSSHNGKYLVTTAGALGVQAILTRAADMNADSEFPGSFVIASEGTANSGRGYALNVATPFTCNSSSQTWEEFTGLSLISVVPPLVKSGNTIAIQDSGIGQAQLSDGAVSPAQVQVALSGIDGGVAPSNFNSSVYGATSGLAGDNVNTTGTAVTLSHSDHVHAMPATNSVATTFSAAGTALAVTNNQTIGGTLVVTGNTTLNGTQQFGQVARPTYPTGTGMRVNNVAIAGQALPYFENINYGFVEGICPMGATGRWAVHPSQSSANISAGSDMTHSVFGHMQRCVASGGGCTAPASSGATWATRVARLHLLSAASTARTFGDLYTSASGAGDPVVSMPDGFMFLSSWTETTNTAQQWAAVMLGVVYAGGSDGAPSRMGASFSYLQNVSSQTGNWQFVTATGDPLVTGYTSTDLTAMGRSNTRVFQGLMITMPADIGIGYQLCDITTPGIGTTATCVRGVQTTNLPTGSLVKENFCMHNATALDGGPGLDGAAAESTACGHDILLEEGCTGWFGVQ